MKLVKIEFNNYKSISGDTLELEKEVTCLVGINEAGKSNVLLALEKVDRDKKLTSSEYSRHSNGYGESGSSPELKLWFRPLDSEVQAIKDLLGMGDISMIVLTKTVSGYRLDYPAINFEKSKYYSPPIPQPKAPIEPEPVPSEEVPSVEVAATENTVVQQASPITEELRTSIRNQVISEIKTNFIPRFLRFDSVNFDEYFLPGTGEVSISAFLANPDSFKPVKNLLTLAGINDFNRLNAPDGDERIRRDKLLRDASETINKEILRVVWPVESVEIQLSAETDILKIQLLEKGKTSPFKPEERSRGMQWTLAFNTYFLAESQGLLKNSVLLIDEPGIFLHINAQNKLLDNTFPNIFKEGNQIIYTTHLPYLIDSKYPERIRILEKKDEDTIIGNKAWSEGDFGKIPEPVKTALGLKWSEMFNLSEKNVIVEGPSDQILLRTLYSILGNGSELNFLPAYGYTKFPSVLAIVKVEEKQGFGLTDGDADIETLRKKCKIVSIKKTDLDTIPVLVNDTNIITIEDILPASIFKQSILNVYGPICDRRNISLKLEEIPDAYPRVKNVEEFFKNKFKKTSEYKLLKMEVARAAVDLLSNADASGNDFLLAKSLIGKLEEKFPDTTSK